MPYIDLHCDTIDKIFHEQSSLVSSQGHINLQKLKQSGYLAQWFALFLDVHHCAGEPFDVLTQMFIYFKEQVSHYAEDIALVTDANSYYQVKKENKIAAFLSVEEGGVIGSDLGRIDTLYEWGVRMMTLTWNYCNQLAMPHSMQGGLTPFGKEVVRYLEEKKILLDLSHLSEEAAQETFKYYSGAIVASHCNCRSIYPHSRNLSDQVLKQIAESGGVVGINFYSYFLEGTSKSTVEGILKHIAHLYQLCGEDVVALGTDYDGINCELEVCNCGQMDILFKGLTKYYPARVRDKFCYQNVERLIQENI